MAGNLFKSLMSYTVALAIVLMSVTSFAGAQNIDGMNTEKEQIEQRLKNAKEKLEKNEKDVAVKEEYKKALNDKMDALSYEMSQITDEIDSLTDALKEQDKVLAKAQDDISGSMELFRKRLRSLYMAGETSYLEVLLGAKDFSECLDMMVLLNSMSKKDKAFVESIKEEMNYITSVKKKLSEDSKKLNEKKEELEEKRTELDKLVKENQEILGALYAEGEQARDELEADNEELKALENSIAQYYAEQKRIAEEKARLEEEKKKQEEQEKQEENENSDTEKDSSTDSADKKPSGGESDKTTDTPSYTDEYTGTGNYVWPVPGFYYLSSVWNEDRNTYNHGAIDIAGSGIYGASVVAAKGGTVIYSQSGCPHDYGKQYSCGCGGGYGNYIIIDHGDGRSTLYAHLSKVSVSQGQTVSAGQVIGNVGSTGHSTGPHLHFETRLFGEKYNPMTEYN